MAAKRHLSQERARQLRNAVAGLVGMAEGRYDLKMLH
jgi:hypothetical protein